MKTRLDHPAADYQVVRSNDSWPDHQARALVTAALIAWLKPTSVLDPACGDGSIVRIANDLHQIDLVTLADISEPNMDVIEEWAPEIWELGLGDIQTILGSNRPMADVVVLTEILEHLGDPDAILRLARQKATRLVASSPEMRPGQIDSNPEHLWQFDGQGFEEMLVSAGWTALNKTHLTFRSEYDFQIWICSWLP